MQTRVTMKVVSFGPAAAVVAVANVICFGVPLVVLGRFADAGIGTLALALIAVSRRTHWRSGSAGRR